MARDHRKLRVFHDAHALTFRIYRETRHFPRDEWFGLRLQLRRASVSIPSNIVEGNARRTTKEYCNFLNIARGSASELSYLITLAAELELFERAVFAGLDAACTRVVKQLERLLQEMEILARREAADGSRRNPNRPSRQEP